MLTADPGRRIHLVVAFAAATRRLLARRLLMGTTR